MSLLFCLLVAAAATISLCHPASAAAAQTSCHLGNGIKHIVYIQFDNVHLRRDNPNVPSDLEQIPSLLNFLRQQGTVFTNHFTPLISHTAVDIVASLTGVYGDKFGVSIGNSFGLFGPNGVTFPSSFTYWTDVLADGLPQMLDKRGKNAPAPWVPFTRAGCDYGAFSTANIEFENVGSDINNVFGADSPQAMEAASNHAKAVADFEGISIHCAQGSPLCTNNSAPDVLKDEPGGYTGFTALFGNVNVAPQISPSGPVTDLDGNVISDSNGNVGFPGFDPTPAQTLGYLATMLEAGVPVVTGYIEDAHDNNQQALSGVDPNEVAFFGPGEAGYVKTLAAFDKAFGQFFARLAKDGITEQNTLFIITADENDHFVGSPPSPAGCDGITTPCTYAKKGEIDNILDSVIATEFNDTTPFAIHFDSAPTFYINGNPGQTDPATRNLEREAGKALGFDPVAGSNGDTNHLAAALADYAEQDPLHMITADPNRTPNFIMFGNPDYFFLTSGKTPPPLCTPDLQSCSSISDSDAWNHGDFQNQITNTWLGMVGPGVLSLGTFGDVFSDETDIRPTILSLAGLKDDYTHDGRVLFEALSPEALPDSLRDHQDTLSALAEAYKAINAPRGTLGARSLTGISTTALKGDDATYASLKAQIETITARRNQIAGQMIEMLEDAAFSGRSIDAVKANRLIAEAYDLIASLH